MEKSNRHYLGWVTVWRPDKEFPNWKHLGGPKPFDTKYEAIADFNSNCYFSSLKGVANKFGSLQRRGLAGIFMASMEVPDNSPMPNLKP